MQKINKTILAYILLLLPYIVHAWGDGDKLDNGACKFNKETGYSGFSLYIKNHESYVIVDVKDSRYGTTSTVYNSKTCKKVTSGDKSESNFEDLMGKKGFIHTPLTYQPTINRSYQNKIDFSQNDDNIVVKVEEIDSSTARELKTLLSSLSDKSASSDISLSSSAKEFLGYKQFYNTYTERLNSLSPMEINYNYALSLNNKFKIKNGYAGNSENIILAKQEEMQKIILAKQEAFRKRVARNNSHISSRCGTYNECEYNSLKTCVSKMAGTKLCDQILSKLGYSSTLTAGVCGATTASLMEETYGKQDFYSDTANGMIDDLILDTMSESDNAFLEVSGKFLKMAKIKAELNECIKEFMNKYYY